MRSSRPILFAVALALGGGLENAQGVGLGTVFTYQGQLKENGAPAAGDYDFVFRLFDAETDGAQVGSDVTVDDWLVVDGLFTVQLDFGVGAFNSEARWLEVGVRPGSGGGEPYTLLSPRQPVTAAPVALYALAGPGSGGYWTLNGDDIYNNNTGHVGIGLTNPGHPLHVEALWSRVIYAKNTASSGGTGVWGEAEGTGVYGYSPSGTGVFGAASQNGYGVSGYAYGEGGYGVRGEATGTSGLNIGVFGKTNSPDGWGGYFIGRGYFSGDVGIGTSGGDPTATLEVENAGGQTAISASSPWIGVYGVHNSTTGTFPGVWGESDSLASSASAVRGIITSTNPGSSSTGVLGVNKGTGGAGIGVWGRQDGSGYGVYGSTPDGRGVYGNSTNGVGVYGYSANGYAGFFDGTVAVDVLEIRGADLAEKFPVSEEVKPGMVVAIDPKHAGKLCMARGAYNRRVAGVVSGANDLPAGAVLGHLPGNEDAPAVALSGRVWVYCDATEQPIEPGDLLTTSATPGEAMKVIDFERAHGAVIGKAMTPLPRGHGLVLVLVSLQ